MKCHIMHNLAFYEGLYCLLRQNQTSKKEIQNILKIGTWPTSTYAMAHPDFSVCSFMEKLIGLKWLNGKVNNLTCGSIRHIIVLIIYL